MPERKSVVAVCIFVFAFALLGRAQDDAPSLGDVARKTRQQKQQGSSSQTAESKSDANAAPSATAESKSDANAAPSASPNSTAQSKDVPGNAVQPAAQGNNTQQNNKDTQLAKPKHVITNDEIPSRGGPTGYRPTVPSSSNTPNDGPPEAGAPKYTADDWAAQIQAQKSAVANLQSQIQQTGGSIQYAGANCVSNCAEWNEQQKRKQGQVEAMKTMLDEAQQKLEQMQDAARQQGYGSSVYEQ